MTTIEEVKEKLKIFEDPNFIFNETLHKYTFNDIELTGGTTFLKKFVKPFDEDFWAEKKAKSLGITKEEMLKQWEETRNKGTELGSKVHKYIEDFYNGLDPELPDENDVKSRCEKFHQIYNKKLNKLTFISAENKIFYEKYNLAGMVDMLYFYKGEVIMGDWKTNKKISTDKDYCYNNLLNVFSDEKENELNKYSIQLSIYKYILKKVANIDVSYCFICHIPEDGDAVLYTCKDYTDRLEKYFNLLDNTTTNLFI